MTREKTIQGLPHRAKAIVGRREMIVLPDMHLHLCAKIDTGARTSAMHAEDIEAFEEDEILWVSFVTRTGGNHTPAHSFRMHVHDRRRVTSSNGQSEWRYIIRTRMQLGELVYPIELSLTNRSNMRHPLLLGRRALRHLLVAPGETFLHGEP